jgi:glycosyltransferase involved in cell wall biosynthesis
MIDQAIRPTPAVVRGYVARMSTDPLIDIVLPCLDEAAALPWVLNRIPLSARAIVVDNGSSDGSADLARAGGAVVVECAQRGYGAACHTGLDAATAAVVAFCDCDGSLDPADALRLAEPLAAGADLVVGRRRPVVRAAWPLPARLANYTHARLLRARTGVRLSDLGPIRVARREALHALDIRDRRSGYPLETVVRAAQAGWRIDQVDVDYHPRSGRSKVTGTVRGYLQAVRDMSAVRF